MDLHGSLDWFSIDFICTNLSMSWLVTLFVLQSWKTGCGCEKCHAHKWYLSTVFLTAVTLPWETPRKLLLWISAHWWYIVYWKTFKFHLKGTVYQLCLFSQFFFETLTIISSLFICYISDTFFHSLYATVWFSTSFKLAWKYNWLMLVCNNWVYHIHYMHFWLSLTIRLVTFADGKIPWLWSFVGFSSE